MNREELEAEVVSARARLVILEAAVAQLIVELETLKTQEEPEPLEAAHHRFVERRERNG